jgi:hypothetical protein
MTDVYQPKKGDRVKVTYEGVVDWVSSTGVSFELENGEGSHYVNDVSTIEKLQNPEPKWVNGDVVQVVSTSGLFVRSGGAWRHAHTNQWVGGANLSKQWADDNLKILYKAHAHDGDYLS